MGKFYWAMASIVSVVTFLMLWPLGLILAVALLIVVPLTRKKEVTQGQEREEKNQDLKVPGAYQKRWLFSANEKLAYYKLKPIAESLGLTVFAKVRLLDLLEPVKGIPKYKTYFYKVQAKHVDFVLCDSKLVARYIIELDDSSHERAGRKSRDHFVDEVVTSVGYKIIHVKAITDDIKEQLR